MAHEVHADAAWTQTEEGKGPEDREAATIRPRRGSIKDRERVEVLKATIGRVVGR